MVLGHSARAKVYAISAAIVFVLVVTGAVIAVATNFQGQWEGLPELVTMLAFGLLGSLVLWRRPGNAMGWVFSAMGLSGTLTAAAPEVGPGVFISTFGWFTFIFFTLVPLPMLYPTGKTVTPRWKWVLGVAVVAYACFTFLWMFQEAICLQTEMRDGTEVCIESTQNPIGIEGIENPESSGPGTFLLSVFLIAGLAGLGSLVLRYRRSHGVERQQLKWLLFSFAALMSFVLFYDILLAGWFGLHLNDTIFNVITAILWLGLPISTGLAVFRYGLYDIDRLISRTLAYGIVVATLTLVYVAVLIGIGALVESLGPGADGDLPVPLIATALVAIAFQPVRHRALGLANRLVFGRRRTPYEALAGIAGGDVDELLAQIARLATESTAARGAVVWLADGIDLRPAATFPESSGAPEPIPLVEGELPVALIPEDTAPMRHQGELLGAITAISGPGEGLPADDHRLLADLANHAAVTLHGALEALPLPAGVVTFLMTDIEGSTRLWEDDPEEMAIALRAHDALARRIVGEAGGVLVKWRGEGDSTFSVFVSAAQGIIAAMAFQKAIQEHEWTTVRPITIRAAVHTGEAELRERDYFGQTVNRCARLRVLARGGQTIVSAATRELARNGLPGDLVLQDLGEQELKDMSEPEHVYEVLAVAAAAPAVERLVEPIA